MKAKIEKISAITLKVTDMEASVRFYRDVLGLEIGTPLWRAECRFLFSSYSRYRVSDHQFATGPGDCSMGPSDTSRSRCGCILDSSQRERIQAGYSSERFLGRTVFPCA